MTFRRAAAVTLALGTMLVTGACTSNSKPTTKESSSLSPTITTAAGADGYPFDATSAQQFPGTSLEQRLRMAQEVCDSIRSHGDDIVAWLRLTKTRNDLVTFSASQQTLVAFSGLAVKGVCPRYLDQLQAAIASEFSTVASSSSPGP